MAMPKIVQLHDENNKKYYPKIKNDTMVVGLNQRQYVSSTTTTKVEFNYINFSYGNGLEFYNNGIKIGKGISKIKVDLTLWLEAYSGYSVWLLYKNTNTQLTYNLFPELSTEREWRTGNSFAYVDVDEGDIIYAYVRFNVADSSNNVAGHYQNSCLMGVQVIG